MTVEWSNNNKKNENMRNELPIEHDVQQHQADK